jgi:four helix bundle protein
MEYKSVLKDKSISFGHLVSDICRILRDKRKHGIIYNQFLRSGTAVGALIHEAEFAQSKADFINKLSIALKEANEAFYWLNILKESGEITGERYNQAHNLVVEIISMLVASVKTAKRNLSSGKIS